MKTVTAQEAKLAGELLMREHKARLQLEKEAADLKLEKRAMQVAFREVELGIAEPFKSHEEFLTKVATLMKEDLDVVEKALERGYGPARKEGELAEDGSAHMDAFTKWVKHGELD